MSFQFTEFKWRKWRGRQEAHSGPRQMLLSPPCLKPYRLFSLSTRRRRPKAETTTSKSSPNAPRPTSHAEIYRDPSHGPRGLRDLSPWSLSRHRRAHAPPAPPAPPHALLPRRSQLLLIPTRLMGRSILGPSPRDEVPPPRTVISKNKSAVKKKLLKLAFTCVCLK